MKNFAVHARKPAGGFWGYLFRMGLKTNNKLEEVTFGEMAVMPNHNVLEIGFGYGHGIKYGLDTVLRGGSGTFYGVDHSEKVCDYVTSNLKDDVHSGKLVIHCGDMINLPMQGCTIDRVFHTNCFHFWPNRLTACKEIYRVVVPGGMMVTGLQPKKMEMGVARGIVPKGGSDIDTYNQALIDAGFEDVTHKDVPLGGGEPDALLIIAKKPLS